MKALNKFNDNLIQYLRRSALRRRLLSYDERVLTDMGFSRGRIERGVADYPWRALTDGADGTRPPVPTVTRFDDCSDAELAQIGLRRADSERARPDGGARRSVEDDTTDAGRRPLRAA